MKKYLLTVLLAIFAFVARAQNDGDIIKVGDQMPHSRSFPTMVNKSRLLP